MSDKLYCIAVEEGNFETNGGRYKEIAFGDNLNVETVTGGITLSSTGGGITLNEVKADTEIASAISLTHSNALDHSSSLDHAQGTDQGLDGGGANAVTALQAKTGYTHSQATHAPTNAQKNSDILKTEIEAKLTGEIASHSHAGGGGGLSQPQIMARSLGC